MTSLGVSGSDEASSEESGPEDESGSEPGVFIPVSHERGPRLQETAFRRRFLIAHGFLAT